MPHDDTPYCTVCGVVPCRCWHNLADPAEHVPALWLRWQLSRVVLRIMPRAMPRTIRRWLVARLVP